MKLTGRFQKEIIYAFSLILFLASNMKSESRVNDNYLVFEDTRTLLTLFIGHLDSDLKLN